MVGGVVGREMLLSGKLTSPQGHVPWAGTKATHHTYGGRGGAGPSQPPPRRMKFTQSPTPISPGAPRKPAHLTPPLAPPCLPVGQNILGAVMGTPRHTRAAQMACGSPRRVSGECGIKAPLFWGFLGPFGVRGVPGPFVLTSQLISGPFISVLSP